MPNVTLRALAVEEGLMSVASIKSLAKKSGFLQSAEAIEASHDRKHKHKRFDALPSPSWVDPGGSQGDTTVNSNNYETPIKILRANQSEAYDILINWPGGAEAYFESQRPAYQESFGQTISVGVFYGNDETHGDVAGPIGLHQISNANGTKIVNSQAGDSGSTTSIFCVKFASGVNGCGLLFDKKVSASGELMNTMVLNDGRPVFETTNTTNTQKKLVYQVAHTAKTAFLSTSTKDVAVYHKIQDAASERPTAAKMDELIDTVESDEQTILYMNRATRRMLQLLNDSKLQTTTISTDYYRFLSSWNGVPIMVDDNILSVEEDTLWT